LIRSTAQLERDALNAMLAMIDAPNGEMDRRLATLLAIASRLKARYLVQETPTQLEREAAEKAKTMTVKGKPRQRAPRTCSECGEAGHDARRHRRTSE
jgi:hypothetical protein